MKRLNLLYLAGVLVIAMGFFASPTPGWAAYGDFISSISSGGLNQPAKVAVDPTNGDVYVTDAGNKMVKKYDKSGNYLSGFSVSGTPVGIAVNANYIFVGDSTNKCVWTFDKTGTPTYLPYTRIYNKLIVPNNKITMPSSIAIAPSGHIFVIDADNDKFYVFKSDGGLYGSYGTGNTPVSGSIYFYNPSGVTMAESTVAGNSITQYFYVGDRGNNRLMKLFYIYDSTTKAITTAPTYYSTVGSKGDAFSQFLSIGDVSYDNNARIIVLDTLQQVGQQFTSSGVSIATRGLAMNYNSSSGVQTNMNIPTGSAVDTANAKLYVANNQANNISVFTTLDGTLPTLAITDPSAPNTSGCAATYNVAFSGTAATSSVNVRLYYAKIKDAQGNNISSPTYTLFSSQPNVLVTGGNYSGTASLDLVGTSLSNFMWAGTYGLYAEVTDANNLFASTPKPATGTILITTISGKRRYTCAMQAKFSTQFVDITTQDSDGDGITDLDEIEGTYNATYAYAPTDPYKADSDGDGLDDGVEEGVKPVNQNTIIAMASTATIHTNPNAIDTDSDGVSDIVEVAKGTDPTNSLDGLSSAQDGYLAYFQDGYTTVWTSRVVANNITDSTVYADLTFLNTNGTVVGGVKAIRLNPHQSTYIWPSDYGVTQGAIELRETTAGSVRAGNENFRTNIYDPQTYDSGWYVNFTGTNNDPTTGSTHLYGDTYCDYPATGWRFVNSFFLFNPNNSTITVTGNWYNNGSIAMGATGTAGATHDYIIPAHGYVVIRPGTEIPGQNWGYVDFSSTSTFNGYQGRERFNVNDSAVYDIGFGFNLDNPMLKTTTYLDTFCDSMWNFINYTYYLNPAETPTTITINYYDTNGNFVANKQYTIQPHGVQFQRVVNDLGQTVINNIQWGSASITATGSGVVGFQQRYRSNPSDANLFDYGYAWRMGVPSTDYLYLPYYEDNVDNYINYLYIRNDSGSTSNVTIQYYDMLGNPAGTDVESITANKAIFYRPYTKGPTKGSAKLTVQSGSVTAYMLGQRANYNYSTNNTLDYGFAVELSR